MTQTPSQTTCPRNLPQHFNGCTCVVTPGAVTAEADVDLFDLRAEAQQEAARLRQQAVAHDALAHRIEAYSVIKDLDATDQVSSLLWNDEPNEDGTFDVALDDVYDSDGNSLGRDAIGYDTTFTAGWTDEHGQPRTAFDAWRDPSTDPNAPIQVAKAHAWFKDYSANRAAARNGTDPKVEKATAEIQGIFQRIKAQPAAGANGTTRRVGRTDVGVSLYAVRDSDGMVKERGTVGDVTLTGRGKHLTFPFGQPSDPDNHDTYEEAEAAAAKVLAEWSD
jgi:hypothetical protein